MNGERTLVKGDRGELSSEGEFCYCVPPWLLNDKLSTNRFSTPVLICHINFVNTTFISRCRMYMVSSTMSIHI